MKDSAKKFSRKSGLLLVILMFAINSLAAQNSTQNENMLTHEDVLVYGGIPYITIYLVTVPALLLDYDVSKYISMSVLFAGGIPSSIIDPVEGLTSTGIGVVSIGSGFLLEALDDGLMKELFSGPLINIGQKTQMWSYYAGYQNARLSSMAGEYEASTFKEESFLSLSIAPWQPANFSRTSVWLPVAGITAASIAIEAFSTGGQNAIWATGQAYLGQEEVPIVAGILTTLAISLVNYTFTAIGEEALFRGIGYEEMKIGMGQPWAMLTDSTLFAGIHVPYEYQLGQTANQLLFKYGTRFGTTICLDWAYDDGGLQASTAQHMWLDVCMSMVKYLFNGGVPH